MPEQMPKIYEGDRPYIFINYARADKDTVLPIIRALVDEGYRVWWDAGIEPTTDYDEYLADHVYGCDCLVMFISSSSLKSTWCPQEVRYALDLNKRVLPVYLEDVELTRGLQMRMGHKQALFWYEFDSDEAFYRKLFKARRLESCLTDEGRLRRGVKPRSADAQVGADASSRPKSVSVEKPKVEPQPGTRIEPKAVPTFKPNGEPKAEPKSAPKAGHTAEPKTVQKAKANGEPQTEHGAAPKAAPTTEPEPEPKPGPATGSGSGASASGRDPVRPTRVEMQPDGRAGSGDRVAATVRVVPRRTVIVPGVVKEARLADYSWDELKELSWAIAAAESDEAGLEIARANGLVDEGGRLRGDEKPLTLRDGTRTSVRILGFRHDELAHGGKAGITFEFADVPATHRMNSRRTNAGGWERSEMRRWLNSDFLALLPDDLRENIAGARKLTNNRGRVAPGDTSRVTATTDRLWLLSANEVYGGFPGVYGAEGFQYKLYADQGVTTKNYGFCAKGGANSWWWLRSPLALFTSWFHFVLGDGDWNRVTAGLEWGVSPGFCF